MKLTDAFGEYLKRGQTYLKPASIRQLCYAQQQVMMVWGSETELEAITPGAIVGLTARLSENLKPASVNAVLRQLRATLNYAERCDWIPKAPRVDLVREMKRRPRVLSSEEWQRLYAAAPHPVNVVMAVAYHAGLRVGEIVHLQVRDLDFQAGRLFVSAKPGWTPKSWRERESWLNGKLAEILRAHLETLEDRRPGAWLFPKGRDAGPRVDLADQVRAAFKRAGLYALGRGMHDLRRTFASRKASAGVPINVLQAVCGWEDLRTAQRYIAATPEAIAAWREAG